MAAESSVLQPRTPPRNPQHSEAISDPWSACSTLTPLSTTLSPTPVLIPIHSLVLPVESSTRELEKHLKLQSSHSSTPDGSCTPRALKRRHSASSLEDAFQGLLSPQRRTISEKQIVGSGKRLIPTPYADAQNYQSFSSDEDEDPKAHGSKLHNSNDELLGDYAQYVEAPEWSDEDLEDLQRCLKEDGLSECLHEYLTIRNIGIPKLLRAFGKNIPDDTPLLSDELTQRLHNVLLQQLRRRDRIENYSTVGDAAKLIWRARRIMVLTGAGISVSCGVPDFRSPDGIYATLKAEGKYDLDDPQDMFSLKEFKKRPEMFYSFISQLWPQLTEPSITHEFIRLLQDRDKLLRNYTQNIDSLELVAGVTQVYHCHGSFATATCMDCKREVSGAVIKPAVLSGKIPRCQPCLEAEATNTASSQPKRGKPKPKKKKKARASNHTESDDSDNEASHPHITGLMKPGITFFGEPLSSSFDAQLWADRAEVDLLVIIGTSLKVRPVSEILAHIPHSIPQILINKTPIEHINPDIVLLGECDKIIEYLCHDLEWVLPSRIEERGQPRRKRRPEEVQSAEYPRRLGASHVWMFEGAKLPMPYARKHDPSFTRERKTKKQRLN